MKGAAMDGPLIAVINDDSVFLTVIQDLLEGEGFRAVVWAGGDGAVELIKRERPALLIADLRMEKVDTGLAVLQMLRLDATTRNLPVILCSADGAWMTANAEHMRAKGYALLAKPFDLEELLALVAAAVGPGVPAAQDGHRTAP
jgi:CheY-like chemotaxis protein